MFGGKKKREALARLDVLVERAQSSKDSTDPAAVREVYDELRSQAAEVEADYGHEVWPLLRELEQRMTALREGAIASRMRPCASCGGRDHLLSQEMTIGQIRFDSRDADSPVLRLLLCAACGEIRVFLARMEDLGTYDLGRLFKTKLRSPETQAGPFR